MNLTAWFWLVVIIGIGLVVVAWAVLPARSIEVPKHRLGDEWPGEVEGPAELPWHSAQPHSLPGDEGYGDEDLELNERIEAEAVAERVIDNLRHIRETT